MAATLAGGITGCEGEVGASANNSDFSGGTSTTDGRSATAAGAIPGSAAPSAANGSGGTAGSSGGTSDCASPQAWDVGATPLRRLTQLEYSLTLQHLLQLSAPPDVSSVPAESEKDGFTVYSEHQILSAQHLRGYLDVATALADDLLADAERTAAVVGCDLGADGCLSDFVSRFGRLAYRRPLSTEEAATIARAATEGTTDAAEPFRFAIEALLISPNFLYRTELGQDPAMAESAQRLTDYEIASRLSFTLLGRGPSAELMDQAAEGALQSAEGRNNIAVRLASEAAYPAFFSSFFAQWLGFEKLISPKDPPPGWEDALLDDMRAETRVVVDRFAWDGQNFFDVLTSDETVLSPNLAAYYRLPTPALDGMVTIPSDHPRAGAGLLGHAALLAKKGDGDAIAKRGNWLRGTFLCRHLEIPEAVAATLGERLVGLTHTQIVRERNTDDACKGCHAAIDPIGVGLDAFDATGRFDPDYVVPDYGIAPGLPDAPDPAFTKVAELSAKLRELPEVASCLTARTFLFTHGSEPRQQDACAIQRAQEAFAASGYDFRALVESLVTSPSFILRRAPAAITSEGDDR